MEIFTLLLIKLLPLYAIIAIGYIAGRTLNIEIKSIAALTIYVLTPIVVLGYMIQMDFKPIYIGIPLVTYFTATTLAFLWLKIAKRIYPDNRATLLTMCSVRGNAGYFGLPLVIALFPPELIGIYMFMLMGNIMFGNSVGYFIWMRGNLTVKDSLIKTLKFPGLAAFIIGLALNLYGYEIDPSTQTYWSYFKGAYIVIGMMILGLALSNVKTLTLSWRFISLAFIGKFVTWPLAAYTLIMIDQNLTTLFTNDIHQMFFILSIVPTAANVSAFAAQLNIKPEKAATTILLGTILALVSIPLMMAASGLF